MQVIHTLFHPPVQRPPIMLPQAQLSLVSLRCAGQCTVCAGHTCVCSVLPGAAARSLCALCLLARRVLPAVLLQPPVQYTAWWSVALAAHNCCASFRLPKSFLIVLSDLRFVECPQLISHHFIEQT
jgi:hypothetical protein